MSYGNAGILDYHVVTALQQGWRGIYQSNANEFARLFPGVNAPQVTAWYNALTAKPLQIVMARTRGNPEIPGVVVYMEGESLSDYPIGRSYQLGGELVHPMILAQQVTVEMRAGTPEVVRALAVVVRAIMHLARLNFIKAAGYADVLYDGSEALSPEEAYIAEQSGLGGICIWRAHYSAKAMVSVPEPLATVQAAIDWFVLEADLKTVDGIPGGVVPYDAEPQG